MTQKDLAPSFPHPNSTECWSRLGEQRESYLLTRKNMRSEERRHTGRAFGFDLSRGFIMLGENPYGEDQEELL